MCWEIRRLEIAVPTVGRLSDRFAALKISIRQRCERLRRRLANGEAVSLIVDSTGMQFGPASECHEQKYGRKAAHTPWRKVNLSVDPT